MYLVTHQDRRPCKWVLGGAEAPSYFWHFYVKDIAHSAQHTTAYDV